MCRMPSLAPVQLTSPPLDGVRVWPEERNFDQRKAKCVSLRFEQRFPDGVHGDRRVRAVYGGKWRHNFEFTLSAQGVKRPGTACQCSKTTKLGCESKVCPKF